MPGKVADASALAAVAFGEPETVLIEPLLGYELLYEPRLLVFEMTNTALKKVRRAPEKEDAFRRALAGAMGRNIEWIDVATDGLFRLAGQTGLSAYDASYLLVAQTVGTPLVTLDLRLAAAARSIGIQTEGAT
ncbi:MAG: type II toxin-antitoxin system VapC family toxin [Chloroflexi bacterium]|nr:type II toxin-antitoxin system VapC family toxin [Chloroflexota bacterium]